MLALSATMADPKGRKGIGPNTSRPSALSIDTRRDAEREESPGPSVLKKHRREPSFISPPINPDLQSPSSSKIERVSSGLSLARSPSPTRPKAVRRSTRTSSLFSSVRSFHSLQEDVDDQLAHSNPPSVHEDMPFSYTLEELAEMTVIKHGQVSISTSSGTLGRSRKSVYLVLTNLALLKFKTRLDASKCFSEISLPPEQNRSRRHSRTGSTGSLSAILPVIDDTFQLTHIVAVYRLDNGLPYFSWELAYWDQDSLRGRKAVNFHPESAEERDSWLTTVRQAVLDSAHQITAPFPDSIIDRIAEVLGEVDDYHPQHFRLFRVAQRAQKDGTRTKTTELSKLTTSLGYLAIGIHRAHFLEPPGSVGNNMGLVDFVGSTHYILNFNGVALPPSDDIFQLTFRPPLESALTLHLMSSYASEIILCLRQSVEYLKPEWRVPSFAWEVPPSVNDNLLPPLQTEPEDDEKDFTRTLKAHCLAYGTNPFNIRFSVNMNVPDSPEFELLLPGNSAKPSYNTRELLAILRSLRYNDTFHAYTFKGISFDVLRNNVDHHENLPLSAIFGEDIVAVPEGVRSRFLLVQELQALVLKNKKLRKVDFTGCVTLPKRTDPSDRPPTRKHETWNFPKPNQNLALEDGSRICEALFPLCKGDATDLDWIVLSEIELSEADVGFMYSGLVERSMHLRGLELNKCGLSEDDRTLILDGLKGQRDTLEVLVLSENRGRSRPLSVMNQLVSFSRIRVLNLCRYSLWPSDDPLLTIDVLRGWRLEELTLSHIPISEATVEHLIGYVHLEQSSTLQRLSLAGCSLNGAQVASILKGLSYCYPNGRPMHLDISHNRLETYHDAFVNILPRIPTPTKITMHSVEYRDQDNFRRLLLAIGKCRTLATLNISGIYLHRDLEAATGQALCTMLAENESIEDLDLSGSRTALETDTLGWEICAALKGLHQNHTLRVLRLHFQELAQPGIGALAEVLRHNDTLQELHCDDNDVSLQSYSDMVHALEHNYSLIHLSDLGRDRAKHKKVIERDYQSNLSSKSATKSATKSSTPSPTSRFRLPSWMGGKKGGFSFGSSSSKAAGKAPVRTSQTMPSTPASPYSSTAAWPLPPSATITMTPVSASPMALSFPPKRLSKAPSKKPSLSNLPLFKRTLSHQNSKSPVLKPSEYEAGMEVFEREWDRQVALCNYYLRRNYCQLMGWQLDVEHPTGLMQPRTAGSSSAQSGPSAQHTPVERSPLFASMGIGEGGDEEVDPAWGIPEQNDEWEGRRLEEGEVASPLLGEEEETPRPEKLERLEMFDQVIGSEMHGSESGSERSGEDDEGLTMGALNLGIDEGGAEERKTPRWSFTGVG